jgi:hypothetical protein
MALIITSRKILSPFTGPPCSQPLVQGVMAGKTHLARIFLITSRRGNKNGKVLLKLQGVGSARLYIVYR